MEDARSSTAPAEAAHIPALDRLLSDPALAGLLVRFGRAQLIGMLRTHLDGLRRRALAAQLTRGELTVASITGALQRRFAQRAQPHLRRVFNLSGTVLHTNLGRAPLPDEAVQALLHCTASPVNLEFDLAS